MSIKMSEDEIKSDIKHAVLHHEFNEMDQIHRFIKKIEALL